MLFGCCLRGPIPISASLEIERQGPYQSDNLSAIRQAPRSQCEQQIRTDMFRILHDLKDFRPLCVALHPNSYSNNFILT